jgi:hypothetical protein
MTAIDFGLKKLFIILFQASFIPLRCRITIIPFAGAEVNTRYYNLFLLSMENPGRCSNNLCICSGIPVKDASSSGIQPAHLHDLDLHRLRMGDGYARSCKYQKRFYLFIV